MIRRLTVRDGRSGHKSLSFLLLRLLANRKNLSVCAPASPFLADSKYAPAFDSPHKQSSLLVHPAQFEDSWCGMGESNSRPRFGKPILYHLTNPACPDNVVGTLSRRSIGATLEVS